MFSGCDRKCGSYQASIYPCFQKYILTKSSKWPKSLHSQPLFWMAGLKRGAKPDRFFRAPLLERRSRFKLFCLVLVQIRLKSFGIIQVRTLVRVVCNSRAKHVRCITIKNKKGKTSASVGKTMRHHDRRVLIKISNTKTYSVPLA